MLNTQTFTVETQCTLTAVTFIRMICWYLDWCCETNNTKLAL